MNDYNFSIPLTVRASDLNYGGHVGYQIFFSYFQEARIAYLGQFGFSELDIDGYGMMVVEANCKYKQELYLNDAITVACGVQELKSKLFVMAYRISTPNCLCAEGYTKNLCYDYQAKAVSRFPDVFVKAIKGFEKL
jgi:acyl-CoA thioester hydrolase